MSEELRAIDADHFWIGEHMVDLVQLNYEANSLNAQAHKTQWWDVHERNRVLGNLKRIATILVKGESQDGWPEYVKRDLLTANKHGLHTGYTERREAR